MLDSLCQAKTSVQWQLCSRTPMQRVCDAVSEYKIMLNFWQPLIDPFDLSDVLVASVSSWSAAWAVAAGVCDSKAGPLEGESALETTKLLWHPGQQRVHSRFQRMLLQGCVPYFFFLVFFQAFSYQRVAVFNKYSNLLTVCCVTDLFKFTWPWFGCCSPGQMCIVQISVKDLVSSTEQPRVRPACKDRCWWRCAGCACAPPALPHSPGLRTPGPLRRRGHKFMLQSAELQINKYRTSNILAVV